MLLSGNCNLKVMNDAASKKHLQNPNTGRKHRKLIDKISRPHSLFRYNKLRIQKPQPDRLTQNKNNQGGKDMNNHAQAESFFNCSKSLTPSCAKTSLLV